MSIIIKHIWRNIKSNSFRSILIIFSLALAAAVFYVNLNISKDANESTRTILEGTFKDYDIVVSGDDGSPTLPECDKILELKVSGGAVNANKVITYSGDISQIISEGLLVLDDTDGTSKISTDGQALMTRTKALYYGVESGDTFTVKKGIILNRNYTLAAYVETSGMFLADNAETGEVFIQDSQITPNLWYLALTDDSNLEETCKTIESNNPKFSVYALYDDTATNSNMTSIHQLLLIILFLVIAIAFFVIFSTQSLIINYRIPILATFRSIGATAAETNLILIAENVVYGLVASVPGIIFGELFRYLLRTQYLGVSAGKINIIYVLLVPIFSVFINIIISLFAIIRANKQTVKELMFQKQSVAEKPSRITGVVGFILLVLSFVLSYLNKSYQFSILVVELILCVLGTGLCIGTICEIASKLFSNVTHKWFGGPAWLGVRNLGVNRINRSTALLVSIVIALVMTVYICVASISGFFASYSNNYPYDILIKFTEDSESHFSYLEELEDVESIVYEYWDIQDTLINGETIHVEFVAKDGYSNGIEVDESLKDNLQDGEAIIDYLMAKQYGYSVGDILTIASETNKADTFKIKIVGFCESGVFNSSRTTIMLTRNDFFNYIEVEPAIIGISTGIDVYEMISIINDATSKNDGKLYSVTASQDYVNSEISEAMSAVNSVSAVPILTILLALCGLVNNHLISFNQKRLTFAVLYSTAMTRKQLHTMMLSELAASFAVGGTVGLLISLWMTKIMRDIIFITIAYVPLVITSKQIFLSLLLLFLLMGATSLFPMARLKKMDIVKEIKYE